MLRAHHIGHLLELPLTSGRSHSIDPDEVVEVGPLHGQPSVTIVRLRDSKFTLYVQGEYEHVREMLRAALSTGPC